MTLYNPSLFGSRIRQYRRATGYTQALLAQRAACSRKTIIDLEAGENVALYNVFGVLVALGLTLDNRMELRLLVELVEIDD